VSAAHCPAIVNVTCGFTDETVVRLQSDDAQVNNQEKSPVEDTLFTYLFTC